jgi:hypothetical protein
MLAQDSVSGKQKLVFVIPNLYGPNGLTLSNPDHEAHFDSAFQTNFEPLVSSLGSQLTSLPIPSPASGFTYTFDKSLGVYTRSAQSFGPILAERAETIGKDKFSFGFSQQFFTFDNIDDINLKRVPAVFQHQATEDPNFQKDLITTDNFIDARISQTAIFLTYGLTDAIDVSVALPVVRASLAVTSRATIQRIGTPGQTDVHTFGGAGSGTFKVFSNSAEASGIGDVLLRVKSTVLKGETAALAVGADFRLPTGDEYDFLGSGAVGVKPFAAISAHTGAVSPHVNVGFQYNGSTILAGDPVRGTKRRLPNQFVYAAGVDAGVTKKLTLALDVLGNHLNGGRVISRAFTAANGAVFPNIAFQNGAFDVLNGSAGLKFNPIGRLLVTVNTIFRMNRAGLRDRVTPLFGVSYTL